MTGGPKSKLAGAAVGGLGFGLPAAVIVAWLLKTTVGVDMPPEVQSALSSIITAAAAMIGTYRAAPNVPRGREAKGSPRPRRAQDRPPA